jgi:hypothetical protein
MIAGPPGTSEYRRKQGRRGILSVLLRFTMIGGVHPLLEE